MIFKGRGKRAAGRHSGRRPAERETGRPAPEPAAPLAAPVPESAAAPALVIDALGRKCPIPIIMLADRLREVPVGAIIAVLADDVAARTDIPAWCRMKSQDFVREETLPQGGWGFHIRRTY